jgi:hypothetical protein
MSRGTAARRRRDDGDGDAWGAESFGVATERDDLQEQGERLGAENARLVEEMREVEGWYRLLQVDHAALQARMAQSGRRMTELQAEANRLAAENQELQALVSRPVADAAGGDDNRDGQGQGQGQGQGSGSGDDSTMRRITDFIRSARRHKWATAAIVTIATLLARDPNVQGALGSALGRVRQAVGSGTSEDRAGADSGFLRYAAMVHGREQVERARREYNENEARLKGDALLEAQDRLRTAKARDRQARLAFLPELARQCERARMPLPREAADALAALNQESAD